MKKRKFVQKHHFDVRKETQNKGDASKKLKSYSRTILFRKLVS